MLVLKSEAFLISHWSLDLVLASCHRNIMVKLMTVCILDWRMGAHCGGHCRHLLLSMLSRFSRVRICATPEMAAHQAPPSLGFSRQEHWSGLPFPSPIYESEKWKVKVKSLSRDRLLATPWTAAYQDPLSMGFARQEYWSGLPLPSP